MKKNNNKWKISLKTFFLKEVELKDHKKKEMGRKHRWNNGPVQEVQYPKNRITECESRENKGKKIIKIS